MTRRVLLAAARAGRWVLALLGFAATLVDELVTAWWGIAPVLPRLRLWRGRVATEWRAYRAGVIDAEVMNGVWR